jgi:hypothetical protein
MADYSVSSELTAYGKTLTVKKWAEEIGIAPRSLKERLGRLGMSPSEEQLERVLAKVPEDKSIGARTRNIQKLMLAIERNVTEDQLDKEIKHYITTNGVIALFKDLSFLWPKGASVTLDGGHEQGTKPAKITIFNEGPSGMVIEGGDCS